MANNKLLIAISTRDAKSDHVKELRAHLEASVGTAPHTIEIRTNNGEMGLSAFYNKILADFPDYNRFVFMHDDITFSTYNWGQILNELFDKHPEFGVIGLAGSKTMLGDGHWWTTRTDLYGKVMHHDKTGKWMTAFCTQEVELEEVAVCDGLFMAVDRSRTDVKFDEDFTRFHFYDVSFTFNNFLSGKSKNGVTTAIRITHDSVGAFNPDEYNPFRDLFVSKNTENLPVINLQKAQHV